MKRLSGLFALLVVLLTISIVGAEVGGYPGLLRLNIPFTGTWLPGGNHLLIQPGDFVDMKNVRYNNTSIEGVSGYSKINTSVVNATNLKIRNGFHFRKDEPAESHVLVQAYNTDLTTSKIYENETAIPTAGGFNTTELHTDASGAGGGRFANAPQGTMVYCNDVDKPQIWPGDEGRCLGYITTTVAVGTSSTFTNPRDYTERVQNTQQTSGEVVTVGGGISFSMLLHCDGDNDGTTFTDTVGTHSPAANGNAITDTNLLKFGTASGKLDGTGDYIEVADHDDFAMSTGNVTIDSWIRYADLTFLDSATKLLLSCDGSDEATTFTDDSCDSVTVTAHGDAQLDTAQKKFGTASALFDGTGDYLSAPDSASWYMGEEYNWAVDFWVRFADVDGDRALFQQYEDADNYVDFYWRQTGSDKLMLTSSEGGSVTASWTPSVDTWYHIAVTARGLDSYIFVDGVLEGNGSAISWPDLSATLDIGVSTKNTCAMNGWMDEIRVSKDKYRWTADFTVETAAYSGDTKSIIWNQEVDSDNYARLFYDACNDRLAFSITESGSETVSITGDWEPLIDTWYHVALIRGWGGNANDYAITVDGSSVGTGTDSTTWPNLAATFDIGKCDDSGYIYFKGWLDEFRVIKGTAAWTSNFTPFGHSYINTAKYGIIGSPYPLDGIKFYVSSANTSTSTMTMQEWVGTGWSSLVVSDSTSVDGVSLAQTGWMTWASTENTAKPRLLAGQGWYWYQYYLSAGAANVYYVTLSAPFENITNIWNGEKSVCAGAKVYEDTNSDYWDYTDEVNSETTDDLMPLDALEATNDYLLLGFNQRQQGLEISFVATEENSTAATALAVYYWGGSAWVKASSLYDGTKVSDISFARNGVITWGPPAKSEEFKAEIAGENLFYYYKLVFDQNIDASCDVYFVEGIPVTDEVLPYKFPVYFQNRILLCNKNGAPNEVLVSAENTFYTFNGSDSTTLHIGSYSDLVAGTSLLSAKEASIDAVAILCKESETWALREAGDGSPHFIKQQLSQSVGCIAPLSMDACEVQPGTNIAVWLSADGPVACDGTTITPISGLEPYFDPLDSLFIGYSTIATASGFIDNFRKEYNLVMGDYWFILDLLRSKWLKKEPGTYPECGWRVQDTNGGQYCYLGYDTGYMMRNEHTNAFDGSSISQSVTLADIPLTGMGLVSQLDFLKLTVEAKNSGDSDSVTVEHRVDGANSWTSLTSVPMYGSNSERYIQHTQRPNKVGVAHQVRLSASTDDKEFGMEPISLDLFYKALRTDTRIDR